SYPPPPRAPPRARRRPTPGRAPPPPRPVKMQGPLFAAAPSREALQPPPRRQQIAGPAKRQLDDDGRQPLPHPLQVREGEGCMPSEADGPQVVDVFDAVRLVEVEVAEGRQRDMRRS